MNFRPFIGLLRDIVSVLPQRAKPEWCEVIALEPAKATVVLIAGFGASQRSLSIIRRRFHKDGFNVLVVALDWSSVSDGVRGFYRMSEELAAIVLSVRSKPEMQFSPVFLVAHSAGGLVARYYMQVLGGHRYCQALVTMATPHRGTWMAALGLMTHLVLKARCLVQMLPVSPFVRRLNARPLPSGISVLSMCSRSDWMCPPRMARLPKALARFPLVRSLVLEDLLHSDFLWKRSVYESIREFLTAPSASSEAVANQDTA